MGMSRKKYQEEIVVTEDVERFFEDVVGMENAKRSLQVFLDSQLMECERKDNGIGDEEEELIAKTSNMAVIGERGSGKTMLADIITDFMIENGVRAEVEVIRKMARNIKKTDDVQEFTSYSDRVIIIENIELFTQIDTFYHILNKLLLILSCSHIVYMFLIIIN